MDILKLLWTNVIHRLLLSYKSTFLGVIVALAVEVLNALQASPKPWIHLLSTVLAVPFLAWKDAAVKDGTIKIPEVIKTVLPDPIPAPTPVADPKPADPKP